MEGRGKGERKGEAEGEKGGERLSSQLINLVAEITQCIKGNFIKGGKTTQDRAHREQLVRNVMFKRNRIETEQTGSIHTHKVKMSRNML